MASTTAARRTRGTKRGPATWSILFRRWNRPPGRIRPLTGKEIDAMRHLRAVCLRATPVLLAVSTAALADPPGRPIKRPRVEIRGIYGGVPTQIFDRGRTLGDFGVNAIWIGSGSITRQRVDDLKA